MHIEESEYKKLCEAFDKLQHLKDSGVENWEGYPVAVADWNAKIAGDIADKFCNSLDDIIAESSVSYPAGWEAGPMIEYDGVEVQDMLYKAMLEMGEATKGGFLRCCL